MVQGGDGVIFATGAILVVLQRLLLFSTPCDRNENIQAVGMPF